MALALCERAYAADPLHAGAKRRLSAWAPEKWKARIAKEVGPHILLKVLRDKQNDPCLVFGAFLLCPVLFVVSRRSFPFVNEYCVSYSARFPPELGPWSARSDVTWARFTRESRSERDGLSPTFRFVIDQCTRHGPI